MSDYEVDVFQMTPEEQMRFIVRRLIRVGTDVRLLAPNVTPAEAEKLAQAKIALERAERLVAEALELKR
jgi:hypothetical protein